MKMLCLTCKLKKKCKFYKQAKKLGSRVQRCLNYIGDNVNKDTPADTSGKWTWHPDSCE